MSLFLKKKAKRFRPMTVSKILAYYFNDFNPQKTSRNIVYKLKEITKKTQFARSALDIEYYNRNVKYTNSTPEQIAAEWKKAGKKAIELGHRLHDAIEIYDKNKDGFIVPFIDEVGLEYSNFLRYDKFVKDVEKWMYLGSELKCEFRGVRGRIDRLMASSSPPPPQLHDYDDSDERPKPYKKCMLEDWKLSKGDTYISTKHARGPLSNIKMSKINKYAIQLNLYRYLMENDPVYKKAKIRITDLRIVRFHKEDMSIYKVKLLEDAFIRNIIDSVPPNTATTFAYQQ